MARSSALLAVAVLTGVAAAPAVAASDGPASGICVVKNVPNVKPTTIKAGVTIDETSSKAADAKADCGVVSRVVRTLAREGAERPTKVQGYACTPTVRRNVRVQWDCTWTGGSPRTSVQALFGWTYVNG